MFVFQEAVANSKCFLFTQVNPSDRFTLGKQASS